MKVNEFMKYHFPKYFEKEASQFEKELISPDNYGEEVSHYETAYFAFVEISKRVYFPNQFEIEVSELFQTPLRLSLS